jgi:4,5-dihydroxyphthalate decarboxylase
MDSTQRHWRFLRNREFDMAELSVSSYLLARDKGLPFRAIPVFPHRRFRHGFVFINTQKGIIKPTDLIGRKVGVKSYQVSAMLWMRGILEHEYGVPHKSMEWYAEFDEDVNFDPPADLRLVRLPHEKSVDKMLAEGEVDAVISPDLIKPYLAGDTRVGRLFPEVKAEEIAYYRKTGIFPIMHVLAIREECVDRNPWIAISMYSALNASKNLGMQRMRDPRIVPLAWYREAWEEQEKLLGPDPWEYGLTKTNAMIMETVIGYSFEQGLISRKLPLDEVFLNVSQGRKRGDERRI